MSKSEIVLSYGSVPAGNVAASWSNAMQIRGVTAVGLAVGLEGAAVSTAVGAAVVYLGEIEASGGRG